MNSTQAKCLAVFSVFAVIGFGPISPGCFIGMFIVVVRPVWFLKLIDDMYAGLPVNPSPAIENSHVQTGSIRIKVFLSLLVLLAIDIAPVPVTPVIAFFLILSRPEWFYRMVLQVYEVG